MGEHRRKRQKDRGEGELVNGEKEGSGDIVKEGRGEMIEEGRRQKREVREGL